MANKEAAKAILDKYVTLGGAAGVLGSISTGKLDADPGNTGYHIDYANGSIYWSAKTKQAHALFGAILQKWISLGGPKSALGYPTSDEEAGVYKKGRWNTFENNAAIVLTGSAAHAISGPIYDKYKQYGGPGESRGNERYPISDAQLTPDGKATFQRFSGKMGPTYIYITPSKRVVHIKGEVYTKWMALGGPDAMLNGGHKLGYPVDDSKQEERADFPGHYVHILEFICDTGMHATIYDRDVASKETEPCIIYGQILSKWKALGGPNFNLNGAANLGYPSTDEMGSSGGARFNQFTCGDGNTRAAIYWHPNAGAHLIYGAIYDHWMSLGALGSVLGFPTSDELGCGDKGGMYCDFSGGSIYWTPKSGCFMHRGPIPDTLGPDCFYKPPQTPDGGIWMDITASCNTHVQLWRNGNVRWWGSFHADGWPSYNLWATTAMTDADGTQYKFGANGFVGGSSSPKNATFSWDQRENRSGVSLNWRALVAKTDVQPTASGDGATWTEIFGRVTSMAPSIIEIAGKVAAWL